MTRSPNLSCVVRIAPTAIPPATASSPMPQPTRPLSEPLGPSDSAATWSTGGVKSDMSCPLTEGLCAVVPFPDTSTFASKGARQPRPRERTCQIGTDRRGMAKGVLSVNVRKVKLKTAVSVRICDTLSRSPLSVLPARGKSGFQRLRGDTKSRREEAPAYHRGLLILWVDGND